MYQNYQQSQPKVGKFIENKVFKDENFFKKAMMHT